jgi:ATP-binding cassette subfamily E protein 1
VAIALSLMLEADLYLIDEPSAYLDSNVRMEAAKAIRRVIEKKGKSAMIVDHDIYFIDLIADSIMVFSGEAAKHGFAHGPMRMREGMNLFLKNVNITFRRDKETRRPRINKLNSKLDREQKGKGEYYYSL